MSRWSNIGSAPEGTSAGATLDEHEDTLWVDSFLATRPGKTYRVEVNDGGLHAAAHETVAAVGRDFTLHVVRRADLEGSDETSVVIPD